MNQHSPDTTTNTIENNNLSNIVHNKHYYITTITGERVKVLPCLDKPYKPKKKRKGKGHIAKAFKNRY